MAPQTFESIDAHVNALDLDQFRPGGKHHFAAADLTRSPGDVLTKVCTLYHAIRPILSGLAGAFFLPKKWRDALALFVTALDGLCP